MTTEETHNPTYADHQAAWEQLPWYVNGALEGEELEEVERHVANCVACRTELNSLHELASLIHSSEELPLSPEASLSDVLARIERVGGEEPRREKQLSPGRRRRIRSGPWKRMSPLVRAVLLGQAAAILVLAGLLALPPERRMSADFRTLSAPAQLATEARTRINLVFEPDTTEARMRELVRSVGGEIIAGPSPLGVYTVATPVQKSGQPSEKVLLKLLRARPEIAFAELAAASR